MKMLTFGVGFIIGLLGYIAFILMQIRDELIIQGRTANSRFKDHG